MGEFFYMKRSWDCATQPSSFDLRAGSGKTISDRLQNRSEKDN